MSFKHYCLVYQKEIEDSSLVRLEIELKDRSSNKLLKDTLTQGLDKVLYNQLSYVMRTLVRTPLLEHHRSCLNSFGAEGVWCEPRIVSTEEATLLWFAEACVGCADRLLVCVPPVQGSSSAGAGAEYFAYLSARYRGRLDRFASVRRTRAAGPEA